MLLAQLPTIVVQTLYIAKYEGLRENDGRASYFTVAAGVCFAFVMAFTTEATMREQARQEVLRGLASTGEATAKSLLSVMSDAVFKLGSDLVLLQPSPHLDALLLRTQSVGRGCWYFPSCIQESDVERVKVFLSKNNQSGQAGSLHASLVDSMGTKVQVQLFHAPMVEMDGTVSNMVGILEDCSEGVPVQRVAPLAGDAVAPPRPSDERSSDDDAASDHSGHSSASCSVHENIIGSCAGGSETRGDVTVDLSLSLCLQVLSESDESRALFAFGNSGFQGFLGRFREPRGIQQVKAWLDTLFNDGRYGGGAELSQKLGSVKIFNPLSTTTQMMEMQGRFLREEDCEGEADVGSQPFLKRVIRFRLEKPPLSQLRPQSRRQRQRSWRLGPSGRRGPSKLSM